MIRRVGFGRLVMGNKAVVGELEKLTPLPPSLKREGEQPFPATKFYIIHHRFTHRRVFI
jgi:hypothetical protein